ncbi:MAG: MFS transporter [Chthoniobacterales bacterium]|nr:MFS transporter [Chthoniobacterales bacterium]
MNKKRLQLSILFLTMLIEMLGVGILIPILPRYAEQLGATSWQIGLLMGIFFLAQVIMLPLWGELSDRIGRRPVLLISILGAIIGYLMIGWTHSILIMLLGRMIDGVAGGNLSIVQAYMSDITRPEERSQGMGMLGAAYGLGFIVGPAFGGWACYFYGASIAIAMVAGLSFINLLVVFFFLPEPLSHKKNTEKRPSLLSILQHLNKKIYFPTVGTAFFMFIGLSMIITLLPLISYHRYDINERQTGYIFVMIGIIAIVVEGGLFGLFSKYFKDYWMIVSGAISMMLAFFLLSFAPNIQWALPLFAMMALGDSLMTPALPAIISRHVDSAWHGAALGLYQSSTSLAHFVGPLLAGLFVALDPRPSTYARTACWIAAGSLLLSFLCSLKIPKEEK